ncbi:hypothetical protein MRX96_018189 [Rhipicephalus microplus]
MDTAGGRRGGRHGQAGTSPVGRTRGRTPVQECRGDDDDGGEVVTMTGVHWCHQQALANGPGAAGKKRLVDSHHSRRASSPVGWTGTPRRSVCTSSWLDVRAGRLGRRQRGGHEDRGPWMSSAGIDDRAGSGREGKARRLLPLPEGVCSCWWACLVGRWPETPWLVQQGRGTRWTQVQRCSVRPGEGGTFQGGRLPGRDRSRLLAVKIESGRSISFWPFG